jgi:hypothetical protein
MDNLVLAGILSNAGINLDNFRGIIIPFFEDNFYLGKRIEIYKEKVNKQQKI